MNHKNKVTVAIALCNNELLVSRCIESVRCQTYENLEILVVDDGSKDYSVDVARQYEFDTRISVICKENGGLSSSRQVALERCTGDYICFIDADDYVTPSYVESMLSRILQEQSDVCICSTLFVDEDGNKLASQTNAFCIYDTAAVKISNNMLSDMNVTYSGRLCLSDSWNKMYRTRFLIDGGISFSLPKGYNGSDLLFNHKVVLHEPQYSFVNETCYVHVIYKNSAVRRRNKDLQGGFNYIISELYKEMVKYGILPLMKNKLSYLYYYLLRYAMQDVYDESSTFKAKYNSISLSLARHNHFLVQNDYVITSKKNMLTKSLRLFNFSCHLSIMMFGYMFIRKTVIK